MNDHNHSYRSLVSRRTAIGAITGVLAAACGREDARAAVQNGGGGVSLSHFGVDRFTTRDQWPMLVRAFEGAKAEGWTLLGDPDATYRRDGPLMLDGVSFDGRGCTFSALSDGPSVLRCIGNNWRLANLRLLGAAMRRHDDPMRNGLWVGDEVTRSADDFVIDNVTVDSVGPGRGVATAGMMFSNARRGRITGATVRRSLADGIHVTGGSAGLRFSRLLVEDTGDDGIAVVSYRSQRRICRDIRVVDAVSRRSAARGFSMVGAEDVVFERVRAEAASAAGIYLYGEGGFDTFGVQRCQVLNAVVVGCVTGQTLPAGYSNAAIVVGGRDGSDRVGDVVVTRGAADCLIRDVVVEGAGEACTAAISLHQHAVRPCIVGARIRGTGRRGGRFAVNGIEIGGRDVTIKNPVMIDIAGLAIVVAPTAAGDCAVVAPRVIGSRLVLGPINSYLYAENAPALRRLDVRGGEFSGGPDRLAISLLPAGRLLTATSRLR